MRPLKGLVIVLGILLVGGTFALIGAIIWRASHPRTGAASAIAAHQPFESALDLPAGATIRAVESAGERLVIRVALAEGGERIIILDIGSGARLGTIELRASR
ncbi:MAG: hypothetical protein JO010_05345 [Alphaproteobacteria bacterium]|nr:hypothetical protein [Alphaproteobacteria bacterium]